MDDKTLQRKLNQFVKLGNELDKEAKRRYGQQGLMFHEADGGVCIMDGDESAAGSAGARQEHITARANGIAVWGAGAW